MLKWTTSAFAMAAAMQLHLASAQDTDAAANLAAPGPVQTEAGAEAAEDAADENRDAIADPRENLQDARQDAAEDLNSDATQREARFAPEAQGSEINDHVRSATQNLNIDDATRARYRWHNGEWWFKTKSGQWKFYRDGKWQDFDPTTYQSRNGMNGSGNFVPQGNTNYAQPQQFSSSSGYYYQNQPYSTTRYGAYRQNGYNNGYNNGWNNNAWNNNGYNNGWNNNGYNNGYNGYNNGYGTGYNPGNDRYYGYGPYGQPYSISGGQYRGGVIGSQIGGQLGGNTGAMIGGAIGARAGK